MRRAQVRRDSVSEGPTAENREGGLDEQPARAAGTGLGDAAAALGLAGDVLAGHEAKVGFELMRVAEALGVIDPHVAYARCWFEGAREGEQRRDDRARAAFSPTLHASFRALPGHAGRANPV